MEHKKYLVERTSVGICFETDDFSELQDYFYRQIGRMMITDIAEGKDYFVYAGPGFSILMKK